MKKNFYFLISAIIILAVIIGLPFAFTNWNEQLNANSTVLAFYIVGKCIFGLCFIAFAALIFLKQLARGKAYMLIVSTLLVQLIPLLQRVGLNIPNFTLGFEIIVLALALVLYVAFLGLVFYSNKTQIASDNKYVGKTIDVVDEE